MLSLLRQLKHSKIPYIAFALFIAVATYFIVIRLAPDPLEVQAEGVYHQINNGVGANGGYDAISWSPSNPLMIDAYGNFISVAQHFTEGFHFIYNNNEGAGDWTEVDIAESVFRPTAVYDDKSDKIHLIQSGGSFEVTYKRYNIVRDPGYNIVDIVLDTEMPELVLDQIDTCSSFDSNNPLAILKDNGSDYTLVAFWTVAKTCGASSYVQNRASMVTLTYTASDSNPSNWEAIDGTDDNTSGAEDAQVANTILYQYNNTYSHSVFQHSVLMKPAGTNSNDLYYFTTDENDLNGFIRLGWNSVNGDWSDGATSRQTFGAGSGTDTGYSLKHELLSKPVYSSVGDRVYVGIARWLDNTNGDTQSLYYVDSSDSITLAGDIYSAGETGTPAHCLYPTFDLTADSYNGDVYIFYDISGTSDCGHVEYTIYNGTTFSTPQTYYSVSDNSIDIPITYYDRYDDRILLLYRRNDSVTPESPPHYIDFGYVELNDVTPPDSIPVSGYEVLTNYDDYETYCDESFNSSSQVIANFTGEISLKNSFRHDFQPPLSPYSGLFAGWEKGTYSGGAYEPIPDGTINVTNESSGGAYQYTIGDNYTFTQKSIFFRARFSSNAPFQHIGFANDDSFSQFIMFSTMSSNTNLYARYFDGTHSENFDLGTGLLDSFIDFKIEWLDDRVVFWVNSIPVHSTSDTLGVISTYNSPLGIMLSNNTDGSDLIIDYIGTNELDQTSGVYTSCIYDSGTSDSVWALYHDLYILPSTSVVSEARFSQDKLVWTDWESSGTGEIINEEPARYFQYRVTLTGTNSANPLVTETVMRNGTPPHIPTDLGPVEVVNGGAISLQSPQFQFTITDPTESQQVVYRFELASDPDFNDLLIDYYSAAFDQGILDFTVGQLAGDGGYDIGSEGQTLGEGSYYWRVTPYDFEGYAGPTATANSGDVAFSIDLTLPEVISVNSSTANGGYGIADEINVNVNFSENVTSGGSVTVNLDSGGSCSFTVSDASSGSCIYTVGSGHQSSDLNNTTISGDIEDGAGNVLTDYIPVTDLATNKDIVIDGIAPAAFSPTLNVTSPTSTTTPTLFFSTSDNVGVSRYEVSINNGSYSTQTSPYIVPALSEGVNSLRVRAFDAVENSTLGTVLNLTIDSTPPNSFAPVIVGGSPTTDKTPDITFSTTDSVGINYYQVKLDNGDFSTQTSPYTISELTLGDHILVVRAYDLAGNYRDGELQFSVIEESSQGGTTGSSGSGGSTTSGGGTGIVESPEVIEDDPLVVDQPVEDEEESDIAVPVVYTIFLEEVSVDFSSNEVVISNDTRPVLSGTSKPGYPVAISFEADGEAIYCNTVADAEGYWSCRPSEELERGVVYGVSIVSSQDRDLVIDQSFRIMIEEEKSYLPYLLAGGIGLTLLFALIIFALARKRR